MHRQVTHCLKIQPHTAEKRRRALKDWKTWTGTQKEFLQKKKISKRLFQKWRQQEQEGKDFSQKPHPGRPRLLSEAQLETMKLTAARLHAEGKIVTREVLRAAAALPEGTHPQRISDARHIIGVHARSTRAKARKYRGPTVQYEAGQYLHKERRHAPLCDYWWFDEKKFYSNATPRRSLGIRGEGNEVEKTQECEVHYSQLSMCNSVAGFLVLKVIKHETGMHIFTAVLVHLVSPDLLCGCRHGHKP